MEQLPDRELLGLVVFDDQQSLAPRPRRRRRCRRLDVLLLRRGARCERRPGIFQRQIEREGRALAGQAAQVDLAAEQARELAADRKTEAGAAIFAAGAGVGLLERLEDQLLLLERNADAGVRHFER